MAARLCPRTATHDVYHLPSFITEQNLIGIDAVGALKMQDRKMQDKMFSIFCH